MHKKGGSIVKIISRNCKNARDDYYANFTQVIKDNVLAEDCAWVWSLFCFFSFILVVRARWAGPGLLLTSSLTAPCSLIDR